METLYLLQAYGAPAHQVADGLLAETDRKRWGPRFAAALAEVPAGGGRTLAGAGSGRRVTRFNCFVMGDVEDYLATHINCGH
jgi:ribonucleoside-diphosphate reductase alpha chain